jgi:hypothetical protein
MLGHSKPQIMLCEGSTLYVVKFHCSAYGPRQLASEYIAYELARLAGLPVPDIALVDVSSDLIENTPDLVQRNGSGTRFIPGLQFGSRFIQRTGGSAPTDYLPQPWLSQVTNRAAFAGIFILDKWCGNRASRKAVFQQDRPLANHTVCFVGCDGCFGGETWELNSRPDDGFYNNCVVYREVSDWDSFEPFLSRLLSMTPEDLWQIARRVPPQWYDNKRVELETLVEGILARRSRVHQAVAASIEMFPKFFPSWRRSPRVFLSNEPAGAVTSFWEVARTIT